MAERKGMRRARVGRSLALVIVGAFIGTALLTPAGAHVGGWGHNWKQHIRPKTDSRYFTKNQANQRFINDEAGSVGATQFGTTVTRSGDEVSVGNQENKTGSASCQSGEQLISGGLVWSGVSGTGNPNLYTVESVPSVITLLGATLHSWVARGTNLSGSSKTFRVRVLCLQP